MSGSSPSSKLVYRWEQWPDVRAEMKAIWEKHNAEIAAPDDREAFEPDWHRFEQLHRDNAAHWVTVRHFGRIVGYVLVLVSTHLHRASTLCGFYDLYWLDPDYRRGWTGIRLLKFCESSLRARGVKKIYVGRKLWTKSYHQLFRRLGLTEIELIYSKAL